MKIKIAPSRIKELVIFCVIMAAVLILYIWVRYSRFADWEYAVMPSFWYSCLCIVLLIAEVSYHKNLYITVESTETGFVAKRFNKTLCVVTDKSLYIITSLVFVPILHPILTRRRCRGMERVV